MQDIELISTSSQPTNSRSSFQPCLPEFLNSRDHSTLKLDANIIPGECHQDKEEKLHEGGAPRCVPSLQIWSFEVWKES